MKRYNRLIIAFAILFSGLALLPQVSLFANTVSWQLYANVYEDVVTITRARYDDGELEVRATSTSEGQATLQVFKSSTNQFIGTLEHHNDEKYRGEFDWAENPQQITVRSSLGGESSVLTGDPPPPPSNALQLQALASQNNILVEWTLEGSLNGNLEHYDLYRTADGGDNVLVTSTMDSQYTDADLAAESNYCYTVKAVDSDDNILGESNQDCATLGTLTLWVPNQVVPADSMDVPVTINLSNGNGLCIRTLDIKVSYDETVVDATGEVSTTIFTQGYAFEADTTVPGEVKISSLTGAGECTELFGPGSLFNIFFNVIGAEGDVSPLDFIEGLEATAIYDEDNLTTPVSLTLQNGSLSVGDAYIRGDINGDGVVNTADAAWSLDIASGLITPTAQQLAACDINGDAACNSADSSLILCYAAFQNWQTCGGGEALRSNQAAAILTLGQSEQAGESVMVPVTLEASNFAGGDFTFTYDSSSMTATGASTSLTGFQLVVNTEKVGIMQISLASNQTFTDHEVILELEFTGSSGAVHFGSVKLHDENGRDFETSALQRTIELVPQKSGPTQHLLYLPSISR